MENPIVLYGLATLLALVPAIVWLTFICRGKQKWLQAVLFLGSTLSVVPVFAIDYLTTVFPKFNLLEIFQSRIEDQNFNFILLFISVGIVEEIVKQALVRIVDKKYLLIQSINDSIRYSLIGAMGFAFAENIFYIVSMYFSLGIEQLIVPYMFRTIFTTAAHLIFSGFFGYYYGMAKFSLDIVEQKKWAGNKNHLANLMARVFRMSRIQAYKESTILWGLTVAIVLHTIFNFLLQLNQVLPVALGVITGFGLLMFTLRRKTGKLNMVTDASETQTSSMAASDEDVVVELLGMWFKEQRYVDVLQICQRLLKRDPDNKIVQIFKAQALDKMNGNDAYGKILKNIFPGQKSEKTLAQMVENKKEEQKKNPQPLAPMPPKPTPKENQSGTYNLGL